MAFGRCPSCGVFVRPHTVCPHCGDRVGAIEVTERDLDIPAPKYGVPVTHNPVAMGCLMFYVLLGLGVLGLGVLGLLALLALL